MARVQANHVLETGQAEQSWKGLYVAGGLASIVFVAVILAAVVAYFIWPYTPGFTSAEHIFGTLQDNRIAGLMSLDLLMVVAVLVSVPIELALYVALKQVDRSYALIALVLVLLSVVLCLQSRPIAEVVYVSDQYAAATTELARSQYLAAGEALLAHFNGTAWMLYTVLTGFSGVIFSLLMFRSHVFGKLTGYTGIVLSIAGIGVFIPAIGIPLSLLATVGGVLWYVMIGRELLLMVRSGQAPSRYSADKSSGSM
jgi:hypothetical protein